MFDVARGAASDPNHVIHALGWITVFDCTLGSGARAWSPPELLTTSPIGFGFASKCLDAESSSKSYSIRDLKAVLLSSEEDFIAGKMHPDVTRKNVSTEAKTVGRLHHQSVRTNSRSPSVRYFDGISLLKVDVEGYEFNAIPAWARDELRCMGQTQPKQFEAGSSALIDFEVAAKDYFSVSLLSMEFHRSGHKYPHGAGLRGALRAHYMLLHIYSLGFIMTGQEKNHQDNCCYELVWVHYRHFIRSEVWMVAGDTF
jgi:hypothetical protein